MLLLLTPRPTAFVVGWAWWGGQGGCPPPSHGCFLNLAPLGANIKKRLTVLSAIRLKDLICCFELMKSAVNLVSIRPCDEKSAHSDKNLSTAIKICPQNAFFDHGFWLKSLISLRSAPFFCQFLVRFLAL